MAQSVSIDTRTVMKDTGATLIVNVNGLREFGFRLWIAEKLITLAAFIMWCEIDFQVEETS